MQPVVRSGELFRQSLPFFVFDQSEADLQPFRAQTCKNKHTYRLNTSAVGGAFLI